MPNPVPPTMQKPLVPPSLTHHLITPADWNVTHPRLTRLCVGGLIFRKHIDYLTLKTIPQILLIKRAITDSYPNCWEIPGGSVDPTDTTLLNAVVREVWEETGLSIKSFKAQVWDFRVGEIVLGRGSDGMQMEVVVGTKPGEGEVEFLSGGGDIWCKLNFVVDVGEVKAGDVVLDKEEHQDWAWFGRDEILGKGGRTSNFISAQAVRIIELGFEEYEK